MSFIPRISQQGDGSMKSNFEFLNSHFPVLANFGELAEKYLYSDSNSCLMKLGMIGETIVNLCFTYDRIPGSIEIRRRMKTTIPCRMEKL